MHWKPKNRIPGVQQERGIDELEQTEERGVPAFEGSTFDGPWIDNPQSSCDPQTSMTRRGFLSRLVDVLGGAFLGLLLGKIQSVQKESSDQKHRIAKFWELCEADLYSEASSVALDIWNRFECDAYEGLKWLNNLACVSVSEGLFGKAQNYLKLAERRALQTGFTHHSPPVLLVRCNLAYVKYHLGSETRELLPDIEKIARGSVPVQLKGDDWLQLWSRRPNLRTRFVSPFGVLGRLYAKAGKPKLAFEAFEEEIRREGRYGFTPIE